MVKVWIVLSVLGVIVLSNAGAGAQKPKNIVLIVADDLDADEIRVTAQDTDTWATQTGAGQRGLFTKPHDPNVLTPHIDSLAKDGALLTKYHVSNTQCTASRYAMLTGRHATRGDDLLNEFPAGTLANLGWHPGILRDETNLAKSLKGLGYRTGIIGKWHNIPKLAKKKLPNYQRADHLPQATYKHTLAVQDKLKAHYDAHVAYLSDGFGWDVVDRMEWGNSVVNLQWQCEGALKFIEESAGQPFFLYVPLPVPHGQYSYDYNNIKGFDDRVTSSGIITDIPKVLPPVSDVYARTDAAGVKRNYAMATRMDDYVGAILQKLDALGLSENTLVIFSSDHGSRGKNSCYEGGAHVPFIARWPEKIKPNTKIDSLVASVDLPSTLIDIAGGTPPADMLIDGNSFKPMLLGQPEPANWRNSLIIEAQTTRAVVTKKRSYIANRITPKIAQKMAKQPGKVFWSGKDDHNYQTEKMYAGYWDADQLYDLVNDPYQQVNLIADQSYEADLNSLRAELDRYIATTPHSFGEFGTGVYEAGTEYWHSVEFIESEGYVKGKLKPSNGWAGTLEQYRVVQPAGQGYLQLPKKGHEWMKAVLNAELPLSDSYEVTLDFMFGRKKGRLDKDRGVLMAQIKEQLNNGNGSGTLAILLMRSKRGDKYFLQLNDSMKTEQWTKGVLFNQGVLGFDGTMNISQSKNLRLKFKLERGSTLSDWTFTGTMENLDDKKVVSILTGTLDSSRNFFTDEKLFACINSADSEDSSLVYKRKIQKITARSSGT